MQNNILIPRWLVMSLGFVLLLFLILATLGQIRNLKTTPQAMQVSATASLDIIPDIATVNLGILSEGAIQTDVQNENIQKTNQVVAFLKQQKINSQHIKTSAFYSAPIYQYQNGKNTITGYQTSQTITVEINQIDQSKTLLEKIVKDAMLHGANQIQGITFRFSNREKLEQSLRKKAIDLAKEKAQYLAANTSLKLGRIINVITPESAETPLRPYALSLAKVSMASPNIEAGRQTISETMTLVFEVY